jgi:hypothetical protein
MPDQPRGEDNEVDISYECGEEEVGRGDHRRGGEFDAFITTTGWPPEDDDNIDPVESKDEGGDLSVDREGAVSKISHSSKVSPWSCRRRLDRNPPLRSIWGSCSNPEN